jgi:uncharacterized OB-fold protein
MNLTIPQGWQCPVCNKVYSPTTPMCFTCPQTTKSSSNTGGLSSNQYAPSIY